MRSLSSLLLLLPLLAACPDDKDTEDTEDTEDTGSADTDEPTEDCVSLTLDEGNTGTYTIDSAGDDHVKAHFDMPEGIDHLIATATWDETEWKMLLDLGVGGCPHSGTSYVQESSDGGSVTVELWSTELDEPLDHFVSGEQWFVHLGEDMPVNPEDGATSGYSFEIQACQPR